MWTRRELKERAKYFLRGIYWKAFWVSIVIALATGGSGGGSSGRGSNSNNSNYDINLESPESSMYIAFFIVLLAVLLLFLLLRIFIGYSLEVGGRRYFIQSAQYSDNRKCFSFAFRGENYLGIVLTMLLKAVFNSLWYLLLIVPGIIKSYSYRMVPYILADNPNIGYTRAITLSRQMTRGHKFRIFVLDLSFIGWYLLGLLALIIGMLFVLPYENATNAELYLVLRKNALDYNMCSYEELQLVQMTEEYA